MLDRRPADKLAVIESENKSQRLGFVDYVENLTDKGKTFIDGKLQIIFHGGLCGMKIP